MALGAESGTTTLVPKKSRIPSMNEWCRLASSQQQSEMMCLVCSSVIVVYPSSKDVHRKWEVESKDVRDSGKNEYCGAGVVRAGACIDCGGAF